MKLSREVKTGIIALVGIFLFILGYGYLKSAPIFDQSRTFYAVYDNVQGLQNGTQVSLNGLTIGNVSSIKFKDNSGKLFVTFNINTDFEFSKNSTIELFDTGIIGGKGLQIIQAFDNAPMAQSGDTLRTVIKPGLTELVQQKLTPLQMKVEGAVSHADTLLMNVNDVLDAKTKMELRQSIAGLNGSIRSFETTTNALNALLVENKEVLDSSIKNFGTITANFSKLSKTLSEADFEATIKGLQESLDGLNGVLASIEKGEGTLGKLAKDEALYTNLSDASHQLQLLLQDFRLNPKRYVNVSVFGKKQKDYELPENDPAAQKEN